MKLFTVVHKLGSNHNRGTPSCILTSKCLFTIGVTLNSPKLKVGSMPSTLNSNGSQQNLIRSFSCCSLHNTAIGSGVHVASCTNLSFFSGTLALFHYYIQHISCVTVSTTGISIDIFTLATFSWNCMLVSYLLVDLLHFQLTWFLLSLQALCLLQL